MLKLLPFLIPIAWFLNPVRVSCQHVAACSEHSLAICGDSLIQSWGDNYYGQLGNGNNVDSNVPLNASWTGGPVLAVSGGLGHSLVLLSDSTVWSWGNNGSWQLGNGTTVNSNLPVKVDSLHSIIQISSGAQFSLALRSDGTVWGWGANNGMLGNGTMVTNANKTLVDSLTDVIEVAGGGEHALALKSDGTVWAWGINFNGTLGNNTIIDQKSPVQAIGLDSVVAISAGMTFSLALHSDGTVSAWGSNYLGELCNGTNTESLVPIKVLDSNLVELTGIIKIACGWSHALAMRSDSTLIAWGDNSAGQLGTGTSGGHSTRPVNVVGPVGVVSFSGGAGHSMALTSDGSLFTWGANGSGQLGDGTNDPSRALPLAISTICQSPTGVVEPETAIPFTIYPNPNDGNFKISFTPESNESGRWQVQVFDLFGKSWLEASINEPESAKEIELSDLPSGIYLARIYDGKSAFTRKVAVK